jgi:hypothetical protein
VIDLDNATGSALHHRHLFQRNCLALNRIDMAFHSVENYRLFCLDVFVLRHDPAGIEIAHMDGLTRRKGLDHRAPIAGQALDQGIRDGAVPELRADKKPAPGTQRMKGVVPRQWYGRKETNLIELCSLATSEAVSG